MQTHIRAATGTALLYVITAGIAMACPAASDLNGAGIRFIGADGADEVHRRLDAERIEIDYVVEGAPLTRSILVHGVYIVWHGDLDEAGRVVPGAGGVFARAEDLSDLPVPAPGLAWTGDYVFTDSSGSYTETGVLSVGAPTTWTLGDCTLTAMPAAMTVSDSEGPMYTETMMYLPDYGTAVLVEVRESEGSTDYDYTAVRANTN